MELFGTISGWRLVSMAAGGTFIKRWRHSGSIRMIRFDYPQKAFKIALLWGQWGLLAASPVSDYLFGFLLWGRQILAPFGNNVYLCWLVDSYIPKPKAIFSSSVKLLFISIYRDQNKNPGSSSRSKPLFIFKFFYKANSSFSFLKGYCTLCKN